MPFNDPKASYKALFYFKDKNKRTFNSRDFSNSDTKKRIPELGLKRLIKLVTKYGKQTNTALIIDRSTDKTVKQFYEGIEVPITESKEA